jgi:hypothetical protein
VLEGAIPVVRGITKSEAGENLRRLTVGYSQFSRQ